MTRITALNLRRDILQWHTRYVLPNPYVVLAVGLLVFYGPIVVATGTVMSGGGGGGFDKVLVMLWSLGDDRPAGRFFPYFDLASNARLWGNDLPFNPLHLTRLVSIALGSNQIGWAMIIVLIHSMLFLTVYYYTRRVFGVSKTAAIVGGMVAFFHTSWLEWTSLVYWTSSALLVTVAAFEYWRFINTGRRRHLVFCILANSLHPYVGQGQSLVTSQVYLLGAVLLIAFYGQRRWASTIKPLLFFVWPITLLGWMPVITPVLLALGSGFLSRSTEAFSTATAAWRLDFRGVTQFTGLLTPFPPIIGATLKKLGLTGFIWRPSVWLFGSFYFVPALLVLWGSGKRRMRIVAQGAILCLVLILLAGMVVTPYPLVNSLGLTRLYLFPTLSGIVVGVAIDGWRRGGWRIPAVKKVVNHFYWALLGVAVLSFIAVAAISGNTFLDLASRAGLVDSGQGVPKLLSSARIWSAGIAVALLAYFWAASRKAAGNRGMVWVWMLAIAAPVLTVGHWDGWYNRPPSLDLMLEVPPEVRFLQQEMPSYEYRVGVAIASEMHLARRQREAYRSTVYEDSNTYLIAIRKNDVVSRQGIAYAMPLLHLYSPYHVKLRQQANATLEDYAGPQIANLYKRSVIVDPDAAILEDYGVRYWVSDFDLERAYPGRMTKVFEGDHVAVYENAAAKPVAYFVDEPQSALPLKNSWIGFSIPVPPDHKGQLSVHVDLSGMKGKSVTSSGDESRVLPSMSGDRWLIDIPEDTSRIVFAASEFPTYIWVSASSMLGFLVAIFMVGKSIPVSIPSSSVTSAAKRAQPEAHQEII